MKSEKVKLSEREREALLALRRGRAGPDAALSFKQITRIIDYLIVPPPAVRRTVRSLARKGLAEYRRGLFTEDGMVAGAGYGLTTLGWQMAEEEEEAHV